MTAHPVSPNRKKMWGIVLVSPTNLHPNSAMAATLIGKWIGISNGVNNGPRDAPSLLFFTRKEAGARAKEWGEDNNYWIYGAKKYHGKR